MKKIVALVLSLVMVLGLATTAFGAASMKYWNLDGDGKWQEVTDPAITALFVGADEFEDMMADDDNYLPCYKVGSTYYVEVPEAQATRKMTYGAKTLFLTDVPESVVRFENKAVALTVVGEKDDATCGEFYDTAFDEDYDYYVTYNKKGEVVATYVAGTENENINILVGGKLVEVELVGTVKKLGHAYVGYDVVNFEYTTVKCLNCGKVANLYANATAAGKDAVKVDSVGKWITFADATTYGVSAPEASEKVESAETFDAGIAMYVGMSVMAAAGSAVVLKKKD